MSFYFVACAAVSIFFSFSSKADDNSTFPFLLLWFLPMQRWKYKYTKYGRKQRESRELNRNTKSKPRFQGCSAFACINVVPPILLYFLLEEKEEC